MNILFIANCASMYGANTSMIQLIKQLKSDNINIFVWLPKDGDVTRELRKLKCKYKIVGDYTAAHEKNHISKVKRVNNLLNNILYIKKNLKLIKEWDIDIIHTNSAIDCIGGLLSLYTGIPHVWHIREMMEKHYHMEYDFPPLGYFLLKRANKVIFISEATRLYWQKKISYRDSCMIYNGFDLEQYISYRDLEQRETIRILIAGIICPKKGQMDAVKAIQTIKENGIHHIKLSIVGEGERQYVGKMKEYIRKSELEDYIEIRSFQKDLRGLREDSDIALMCSRDEALGRVTIESMASQLLVIGADSGGTSELIADNKTGYLYEVGNWRQLAEKILYAVDNWDTSCDIIKLAQTMVIEKFSIDKYAKKIEEIYREIIDSN